MESRRRNGTFPREYVARVGDALVKVDACLCEALHCLDPAVLGSPFPTRIADAVPVHRQLLLDNIRQIRKAMQTIVERHRLRLPRPTVSALEACRLRANEAMLADSLAAGFVLIDTPGVDWERSAPGGDGFITPDRCCDLALVLISATSELTLPEAALVESLVARAAHVIVFVTKTDFTAIRPGTTR